MDTTFNNTDFPQRHSLRLSKHNYAAPRAYFVTICTHDRQCIFGDINDGVMRLNGIGNVISDHWQTLPTHHANLILDAFVIMPNHVHGIMILRDMAALDTSAAIGASVSFVGAQFTAPDKSKPMNQLTQALPLGKIIRGFKARCTVKLHNVGLLKQPSLWQRNYYEHVIRNEDSLGKIRNYIVNNPLQWHLDRENPDFM